MKTLRTVEVEITRRLTGPYSHNLAFTDPDHEYRPTTVARGQPSSYDYNRYFPFDSLHRLSDDEISRSLHRWFNP